MIAVENIPWSTLTFENVSINAQTNQSLFRKHSPLTDKFCNVYIMNGWYLEWNQVFWGMKHMWRIRSVSKVSMTTIKFRTNPSIKYQLWNKTPYSDLPQQSHVWRVWEHCYIMLTEHLISHLSAVCSLQLIQDYTCIHQGTIPGHIDMKYTQITQPRHISMV